MEDYIEWCYRIKQNSDSLFKAAGLNIESFNTMLNISILYSLEDQKESQIRKKYIRIILYDSNSVYYIYKRAPQKSDTTLAKEFEIPIEEVYSPNKVIKWNGKLDEAFWDVDKELEELYYFQDDVLKLGKGCNYDYEQCLIKFDSTNKLKYVSIGLGNGVYYNDTSSFMPPKKYKYWDNKGKIIIGR